MQKSDKIAVKVARRRAKSVYKTAKAEAKYAYKLMKGRKKLELRQSETAESPRASERAKAEAKAEIRLARQTYKNIKAQEKNIYLTEKAELKRTLKKQKHRVKTARPPASLSFSLAAAFVLVFMIIMVLQEVFVLWTVSYLTDRQSTAQLDTVYSTVKAAGFSEESASSARVNDISFVALRKNGQTVYAVGEPRLADTAFKEGEGVGKITVGAVRYKLLTRTEGDKTLFIVKNLQAEDDIFALLLVVMSVATVIAAIASGVVGISVSQSCLRPIHSMSRLMKEMNVSDLSARLNTRKIHTELRDVATHYNEMMDRLEASYAAQARFVSDASHELRTPLSVISGYADILERWGSEEPAVLSEAVHSISDNCSRMNELLERLLAISRLDNALPEAKAQEAELYPFVQELIRDFELVAGERTLEMQVPKSLRFAYDSALLRQILVIFLDNAVKFTPADGEISVFAAEDESEVCVGVKDNGIGIPADKLERIFDRFYKADPARGEKGYGLGLSIAGQIASAMETEISVQSEPGERTVFCLHFKK